MAQKYKPQHRRLVFIDQQISAGSYPNCSLLSEGWEVSAKTIQRDIDYLRDELGAPIEYSPLQRGYYYRERTWRLPAIQLSEGDLFFISVAENVLEQYENTPLQATLRGVFDKIRQALPEKVSAPTDLFSPRISVRTVPSRLIDIEVWKAVVTALRKDLRLSIEFRAAGYTSFVRRVVDPYHLFAYSGEWYVIAAYKKAAEPRLYALSRIRSAEVLDMHFQMPKDFDPKTYLRGAFGIFRGEKSVMVRLRFSTDQAPYILERTWMAGQRIKRLKGGEVVLSFRTTHLYEVERWVLSWGESVKVLGPKALLESVGSSLRKAARNYR
jgi:predicted DNA-binding transcriptional regulator YafY